MDDVHYPSTRVPFRPWVVRAEMVGSGLLVMYPRYRHFTRAGAIRTCQRMNRARRVRTIRYVVLDEREPYLTTWQKRG